MREGAQQVNRAGRPGRVDQATYTKKNQAQKVARARHKTQGHKGKASWDKHEKKKDIVSMDLGVGFQLYYYIYY